MSLTVRPARPEDVPGLTALLNQIVAIGGTTAREDPITEDEFQAHYLAGPGFISCVVAEGPDGVLHGFQAIDRYPRLPEDWADIGSFARPGGPKGVGRAMFPATCKAARAAGIRAINAMIRADNVPGLGYYGAMGFREYDRIKGKPLKDGIPVDRILKRYDL